MLDAKYLELHLGILQNRLHEVEAKISVCERRVEMKVAELNSGDKTIKPLDIDVEKEKLKGKGFDKEALRLKKEITDYEDQVLKMTELTQL